MSGKPRRGIGGSMRRRHIPLPTACSSMAEIVLPGRAQAIRSGGLPPCARGRRPDRLPRARLPQSISRERIFLDALCCATAKTKTIRCVDSWSGGVFFWGGAFSLFNGINLVHGETAEILYEPAGPGDFDTINLDVCSQAEVQPKIVL